LPLEDASPNLTSVVRAKKTYLNCAHFTNEIVKRAREITVQTMTSAQPPGDAAQGKLDRMTGLKHQIVQHLPYLRRYARALTGSQAVGDEYIRGCLETLLHEPEFMTAGSSVPVQLFKLFHKFADTVETSTDDIAQLADPVERRIGERLVALAPLDRQALLLVHQEGFSPAEAADVLQLDVGEVNRRIDDAWANLKRQPTTSVLIIEDEPVIALDVAEAVKSLGHRVTGVASRASQAIEMAKAMPPGLVLADIQLKDGSTGITAVREILKSIEVPVVFVTAFPERLLTGEALEPAFVVTKPFDGTTLKVAISQALFFAKGE
jgi:CheY-like chemotaxis protein/DNA-directed RNA polymerase specialized sigma24 family protein